MTERLVEYLYDVSIDAGVECEKMDYSGRFMYGERTWALAVSGSVLSVLQAVLFSNEPYDGYDQFEELRQDQLGLGMVIY
jgi:hypothetical protein